MPTPVTPLVQAVGLVPIHGESLVERDRELLEVRGGCLVGGRIDRAEVDLAHRALRVPADRVHLRDELARGRAASTAASGNRGDRSHRER